MKLPITQHNCRSTRLAVNFETLNRQPNDRRLFSPISFTVCSASMVCLASKTGARIQRVLSSFHESEVSNMHLILVIESFNSHLFTSLYCGAPFKSHK